jgi:hypothetical protein
MGTSRINNSKAKLIVLRAKHTLTALVLLLIFQFNAFAQDNNLPPKPLDSIPRKERTPSVTTI